MATKVKIYGPNEEPPTPASVPQPQAGKASIAGTLFSYTMRSTIPSTAFYLIPAPDKKIPALIVGPDPSKGDIESRTDSKGQFAIDNVPAGSYYLAVWDNYSWELVVDPTKDPAPPRLLELKEGQALNAGIMNVSWP